MKMGCAYICLTMLTQTQFPVAHVEKAKGWEFYCHPIDDDDNKEDDDNGPKTYQNLRSFTPPGQTWYLSFFLH